MRRRTFLKGSTASLALAGAAPVALFSAPSGADDDLFSAAYFRGLQGAWFHVDTDAGWQSVELIAVEDEPVSPRVEQFHVRFRGNSNTPFDEGVYRLSSDDAGEMNLFLQPSDGADYVASFGLIRPLSEHPGCSGASIT